MTLAPPQNLEAEREVIGTLLVFYKPQLIHVAQAAGLIPRDFYRTTHEAVYRAVLNLHARGEHVDTLTVTRFLATQPHEQAGTWLEHIGGTVQVEFLAYHTVAYGFRERCAIVHEDGKWRRYLRALYDAQESIYDRDSERFWEAIARVKDDVLAEAPLRAIEGGRAA
jgi:replicative DNA helicase